LYEFQFGKKPHDRNARRYVSSSGFDDDGLIFEDDDLDDEEDVDEDEGSVARTTIDALNLKVKNAFFYWFDFGDDWWHRISVVAIEDKASTGKYPKVVKRVGKNPPQYPDADEF